MIRETVRVFNGFQFDEFKNVDFVIGSNGQLTITESRTFMEEYSYFPPDINVNYPIWGHEDKLKHSTREVTRNITVAVYPVGMWSSVKDIKSE